MASMRNNNLSSLFNRCYNNYYYSCNECVMNKYEYSIIQLKLDSTISITAITIAQIL